MGGQTKAIPTGDGWVTIVSNHRQPKWQQPQRRRFHHPSLYNRHMHRYRTSTRVQYSNRHYNWLKSGTCSAPLQYHLKPSYKGKFIKTISDLFPCQAQLQHTSKPHPNHPPTGPLLLPPPTTTSLIHSHPLHSKSKLNMQPCRKPINFGINALAPTPPAHLNNNLPIYASVLRNDADNRNSHSPTFTHNTHWQFFLDNNPWTEITTPDITQNPDQPPAPIRQPLPLPPNPNSPYWKGRCYNCLEFGHDQNDCHCPDRACAKCWTRGHQARDCTQKALAKRKRFDPLQPRGNLGDSKLPSGRPKMAMVFLPKTRQMQQERHELARAVVIDARLIPDHNYHHVQSSLMAATKSELPYPITHMCGYQYLLFLPPAIERHMFLSQHSKSIQDHGLVVYPWTPAINAFPMKLKYKCLLELRQVAPQAWNLDHIIPAVSSFGVVLDHTPKVNLRSLEKLMVVVALIDMSRIPEAITPWVRNMYKILEIVVHGWIEEDSPFNHPKDTTPDQSLFDKVRESNLRDNGSIRGRQPKNRNDFSGVQHSTWSLGSYAIRLQARQNRAVAQNQPLFHCLGTIETLASDGRARSWGSWRCLR